jgi:hypothetical protein
MTETESLYREMAGIAEFLPERPTVALLTNALVGSFQDQFGVEFRRREND